jgi:cell cycle arrest protein BUB3
MDPALGVPVQDPPADGISALAFEGDALLAACWSGDVRVYAAPAGAGAAAPPARLQATLAHGAPVLAAAWAGAGALLSAGLDGAVRRFDVAGGGAAGAAGAELGRHAAGARCVAWLPAAGLAASAGWDEALRLWDARAPPGGAAAAAALPGRAYTMAAAGDGTKLIVATSGRHVLVYDIRALAGAGGAGAAATEPEQRRESSLRHQTRALAAAPDGATFALSSVEGRVAVEYLDPSPAAQAARYAFKCHRRADGGRDVAHPVHALAFCPAHGTFATGGGDGGVCVWDGARKKRLAKIDGYPTSVAALAFSADGARLAVAASYAHERGEAGAVGAPPDAVYVRPMAAEEIAPRR